MVRGYILLNLLPGFETNALSQIRIVPGVKEVTLVFGHWDTIVTAESDSLSELSRMVIGQIRGIQGVQATETLISGEY
ncbi:MAG TPA: Lrp/AsnC ligand binding domain-containing protein [bacterium]|nr:Lrp/AsnC ligand binding domain-containing protein [bacterium]